MSDRPPEVSCRVCGSTDLASLGPPVHRRSHASQSAIDLSDLALQIFRCADCTYQFVHPPIPAQRLIEWYRNAPPQHWGDGEARLFEEKKRLLDRYAPGRRVLDFGCSEGAFLRFLGAEYERLGIEPSQEAARQARGAGIDVVAPTLDDVRASAIEPLDAIVALDVFEHLLDPVSALSQLRALLRPGGIVLIETGNSDTPLWRKYGPLYEYCGLPEHVGFFNERSIREAAARARLETVAFIPSYHHRMTRRQRFVHRAYFMAYQALCGMDRLRLPMPRRGRDVARRPIPRLPQVKDHFLAVLSSYS